MDEQLTVGHGPDTREHECVARQRMCTWLLRQSFRRRVKGAILQRPQQSIRSARALTPNAQCFVGDVAMRMAQRQRAEPPTQTKHWLPRAMTSRTCYRLNSDCDELTSWTMTRILGLLLLTLSLACRGEPPRVNSLAGITLGSSPGQVGEVLKRQSLYCDISAYGFPDEERTEGIESISASTVSVAGTHDCPSRGQNDGVGTFLTVRFARRQIDASTGAMSISYEQIFSRPSSTVGENLSRLKSVYGEPSKVLVEQRPAIGPIDNVIPGLFFYEVKARWLAKATSHGSPCTDASCGLQLSARLSTHGPPGKVATELNAEMVTVYLDNWLMSERDRNWFRRRR
jgi:hypothetical protein